jgi:tetratricopeptide (TPR) repeat protein
MRTGTKTFCAGLTVALITVLPTLAQQGPYILDASRQIGSGGINAPVQQYNYNAYGNLYITGNITAGRSFQGFVPYGAPNQLRMGLGSSALSAFRRDSIGLGQITEGFVPGRPQPYFNPSSTILPLSAYGSDLAIPGSSIPRRAVSPELSDYQFALPEGLTQVRPMTVPILPAGIRPGDILIPTLEKPLAVEGVQMPEVKLPERKETEEAVQDEAMPPELQLYRPQAEPQQEPEQEPKDKFMELLAGAEEAAQEAKFQLSEEARNRSKERSELIARQIDQLREDQNIGGPTAPRTTPPVPASAPTLEVGIVGTLAGEGLDPYNSAMRSAEHLMAQGRFFQAEQIYRHVQSLRPDDPLPIFGQANALIAAGDLRSAGKMLQEAVDRFPGFLFLTVDGSRLLGNRNVLDQRRREIVNRVNSDSDKHVLLLAGYMQLLSGDRDAAATLLERAGVMVPKTPEVK